MAHGAKPDEGASRGPIATVFVCDPTTQSEIAVQALRSVGYAVVDVPLSMLVARIAVQRPRVVVIDADSEGALDVVTRIRELADADAIHVLFVARPDGAITTAHEALAHEASGLIVRPVDAAELVRVVNALTSLQTEADRVARTSALPPPLPSRPLVSIAPLPGSGLPPLPDGGVAPSATVTEQAPPLAVALDDAVVDVDREGGGTRRAEVSFGRAVAPARQALGFAHAVSPELQQLLAEADQRAALSDHPEWAVPSPEEEIEAVVPAEWLAALDELLEDEAEDLAPGRSVLPPGARDRAAGSAPQLTRDGPFTPSPAQTHGGTHSGATTGSRPGSSANEREAAHAVHADGAVRREDSALRDRDEPRFPAVLGPGDAMRVVARAIAGRTTGSLCLASGAAERRVVLRDGDVVTASSSLDDETLVAFLVQRGDLPKETARRRGPKCPPFGRHAAAALIARGYLRQDQMWDVLRAHAEWLLARILPLVQARLTVEAHPPGRLASEPSVFGASPGAEVFVDVVRRVVSPAEALERLGGREARIVPGPAAPLLDECALAPPELKLLREALGGALSGLLDAAPEGDLATVVFAGSQLGAVDVLRSVGDGGRGGGVSADAERAVSIAAMDGDALRERVRARMQLVEDGDYFSLLGVPRDATGYEIRRAFLELRRGLDPSRVLTPDVADLDGDLRTIMILLEEAYEILKDAARRERYRQAIEA